MCEIYPYHTTTRTIIDFNYHFQALDSLTTRTGFVQLLAKVDNQKVERALRAIKKRESGEEHNESPIKTRKMSGQSLEKTQSCFSRQW